MQETLEKIVNKKVIKLVFDQLHPVDVTDLVWSATADRDCPFDIESASDRTTNPSCPYCGSRNIVWNDIYLFNEEDSVEDLKNGVFRTQFEDANALESDPEFAELFGILDEQQDNIYKEHSKDNAREFVKETYGSVFLRCLDCDRLYRDDSDLSFSCDTEDVEQWLLLDEDITKQLREHGEVVLLDTKYPLWGRRKHHGQQKLIDIIDEPALYAIAKDAGLLYGQRHCPISD